MAWSSPCGALGSCVVVCALQCDIFMRHKLLFHKTKRAFAFPVARVYLLYIGRRAIACWVAGVLAGVRRTQVSLKLRRHLAATNPKGCTQRVLPPKERHIPHPGPATSRRRCTKEKRRSTSPNTPTTRMRIRGAGRRVRKEAKKAPSPASILKPRPELEFSGVPIDYRPPCSRSGQSEASVAARGAGYQVNGHVRHRGGQYRVSAGAI